MFIKDNNLINEEICLTAINNNGYVLELVLKQNFNEQDKYKLSLAAVHNNGFAIMFIINQTEEVCLEVVMQNGLSIDYIEERTEEIIICAIKFIEQTLSQMNH